jgi:Domain of unknown function (DUF4190)
LGAFVGFPFVTVRANAAGNPTGRPVPSGMANGAFGGLCERGHDVPVGASFCPTCGSRAYRPTDPSVSDDDGPPPWMPPRPSYGPPPTWAPPGAWSGGGPSSYGSYAQYGPGGAPGVYPDYPYPHPSQYPAPPGQWPFPLRSRPTNGFAVASMVLGILWIYWVGSIFAIIFGHLALRQISRTGHRGRGMAIAGLALGYVGLVTMIGSILAISAISP